MKAEPRLLIRLGSLGDVVLATAAANAACRRWGAGCLDVLVKTEWAAVWEGHPAVRRTLAWPRSERGPLGIAALVRRLRTERYRETFDLQSSPRTRFLTAAAGAGPVHRPVRHTVRRRLAVHWKRWGPPADYSVAAAMVATVDPGGTDRPSLHPGPDARVRAAGLLREPGGIGLVPGARHATKRWPLERFVELGRDLVAEGRGPVAVFFGPDEGPLLAAWHKAWPQEGAWIPVQEPVAVAAACLARLDGVVSNDTGLLHVAAAVGVPVVALFGPTVREFGFFPEAEPHRVLQVEGLACRPCAVHGGPRCPQGHFRCMLDIESAPVAAALAALTSRPRLHPLRSS